MEELQVVREGVDTTVQTYVDLLAGLYSVQQLPGLKFALKVDENIQKLENEGVIGKLPVFPPGRPTRLDLLERQQAGSVNPDYLNELKRHYSVGIGPDED